MAGAVEGEKRHQEDIGIHLRRLGLRLADAPDARDQRLAKKPLAHDQRLAAAGDHRERQPRALPRELAQQRQRVDFALERHEAGDDRARRDRQRKFSRGDRFGGRLPRVRRQRVAPRDGLATKLASCRYSTSTCEHHVPAHPRHAGRQPKMTLDDSVQAASLRTKGSIVEKCGAAPAVGALIPGTYISRWAPCDRTQGSGQGQLPSGS